MPKRPEKINQQACKEGTETNLQTGKDETAPADLFAGGVEKEELIEKFYDDQTD